VDKRIIRCLLCCGVLCALSASASRRALGDILITKSGSKYEGNVTRDGSSYILRRAGGGKMTFPAGMVREVIRKDLPTKPVAPKATPEVRAAVAALTAKLEEARKELADARKQARARHAKAAGAGTADRASQRKELAEYAILDRKLAGARGLPSKAQEAMSAVAKDPARLAEAQAEWEAKIASAVAAVLAGLKQIEDTYAAAAPAGGADWPGWRGPNRDGKSPDTGLLKEWPADGPELLWKVDNIGHGFSSVAVTGGTVYITGDSGGDLVLFAFDLEGKPKWRKAVDKAWTKSHPGARSTPVIHRGLLYLVSGNGVVACLDAKTGKGKWLKQMRDFGGRVPGWGYAESVLIFGKLAVITPGGSNCIVALDQATGRTVWRSQGVQAGAQYGSCLAVKYEGVPMIVAGTHGGIVGVDARTGRGLWSNPWSARNTANCPTPAYADGHVFWANGYGKGGVCMKLKRSGTTVSAAEAWTTKDMVCHHGGYVIHEGHIYGNNGGSWACLDLKTGRRRWNERGVGKGSVCWADGMLYLYGENRGKVGLATCSPDGLEMKGTFNVEGSGPSWAHPVVIGGRLYIRYDTNLYCFNVKAK